MVHDNMHMGTALLLRLKQKHTRDAAPGLSLANSCPFIQHLLVSYLSCIGSATTEGCMHGT